MDNKFINWEEINIKTKRDGILKTTCPKCSNDRKNSKDPCLYVNLTDGVAKCYNCYSLGFKNTKDIREEEFKVKYTLPPQNWQNYTKLSDRTTQYLETRKISQKTLNHFNITQEVIFHPQRGSEAVSIVFNYFEGDILVNKKYRTLKKEFTQSKGGKPILYNINSAIGAEELYITEGCIDVLSLYEIGITNAVSLPNGANDNDAFWINSEPYLKGIKKFYIAVDNDEKGNDVAEKIAQRLGRYRCERVLFDGKDANEDLQNMLLNKTIRNTKKYPVKGTLLSSEFSDGLFNLYDDGIPKVNKPKGREFSELNKIYSSMKGQLTCITGIPSSGKALCVNTPIFTVNGFSKLKDLCVGDTIFDENGNQCNVIAKSDVFKDRPTYRINFSDGSSIIADENHEWLTNTRSSRKSEYQYNKNLKKNGGVLNHRGTNQNNKREFPSVKTTKEIINTLYAENGKRYNHAIEITKPLNFNETCLPVDPYVFGAWLGDGTSSGGGITTGDYQVIENIKIRGYDVTEYKAKYHYGILKLASKLKDINVLNNKHIPVIYLTSSYKQRMELLRGLMDSDGYCNKDGSNEFCSVREILAKDVYTLIVSLGIKCTFNINDAKIYGRFISKRYRLCFKVNDKIYNIDRKQYNIDKYFSNGGVAKANNLRYIRSIEQVYGYETQCIEVDSKSHLFLAGEAMIPTHNSNLTEWYLLNMAKDYDYKLSFFTPEHTPYELFHSKMAEKVIGRPFFNRNFYEQGVTRITKEELDAYIIWANERIYITSPNDTDVADWDWLLKTFEEQMLRYGVNSFIVDAYNKVIMKEKDEKRGIRDVLTKVTQFCAKYNVEVHLIAHPTKMQKDGNGQYTIPTLYDISGSADFRNQTHNGYIVHREYQNNGNDITVFVCGKVKFQFQGEIGKSCNFVYDKMNGRYYKEGDSPNRKSFFDSDYNCITNNSEQLFINDNPYAGISQRKEFDFSSFDEETPF